MARKRATLSLEGAALRAFVLSRDGWTCRYCGVSFESAKRAKRKVDCTIDHVVPISRGGTNHPSNVVAACRRCNNQKGSRTVAEWRCGLPKRFARGPALMTRDAVRAALAAARRPDQEGTG